MPLRQTSRSRPTTTPSIAILFPKARAVRRIPQPKDRHSHLRPRSDMAAADIRHCIPQFCVESISSIATDSDTSQHSDDSCNAASPSQQFPVPAPRRHTSATTPGFTPLQNLPRCNICKVHIVATSNPPPVFADFCFRCNAPTWCDICQVPHNAPQRVVCVSMIIEAFTDL
jgi:hypothetical protein